MINSEQLIEEQMPAIRARVSLVSDELILIDGAPFRVYYEQPYLNKVPGANHVPKPRQSPAQRLLSFEKQLAEQLYLRLFCGLRNNQPVPLPLLVERQQFMNALSAVNASSNAPDLLWQVENQRVEGIQWATKNAVRRPLDESDYVANEMAEGFVDFLRTAENSDSMPDYYHAYSDAYLDPQQELYRIYWNLKPEAVAVLVEAVTNRFNFYRIPFQIKCLNHPDLYKRPDNTLLFVNKNDLCLVRQLLEPVMVWLKKFLNPPIPMFCERLSDGIGLAEDPGISVDYGRYMMGLVARKLIGEYWSALRNAGPEARPVKPVSATVNSIMI